MGHAYHRGREGAFVLSRTDAPVLTPVTPFLGYAPYLLLSDGTPG